jgi:hypothetical protein
VGLGGLYRSPILVLIHHAQKLVATVRVTSETTNSNSLLPKPNTASNYIQQLVNGANSGDVDNDSQSDFRYAT